MKPPTLYLLVLIALLSVWANELRGQWLLQTPLTYGSRLNDVCFVDKNTGTAVGESGTILRTTDGGHNWIVQSSGKTYNLNAVHFTDADKGTVVGF